MVSPVSLRQFASNNQSMKKVGWFCCPLKPPDCPGVRLNSAFEHLTYSPIMRLARTQINPAFAGNVTLSQLCYILIA